MFNPVSTYRIQFHKDFTFRHLDEIIPYLVKLGVKTLYASPIFKAVPGSSHGYDSVDPLSINPEIGTLDELKQVSKKLNDYGISWLQDIVPNHMAFHHDNAWLIDVLEKGPLSLYRNYFDQSLADNDLFQGPLMVPFLGDELEAVIEKGELEITWSADKLVFKYAEQYWPLNFKSYQDVLQPGKGEKLDSLAVIVEQIEQLNKTEDAEIFSKAAAELKLQFIALMRDERFNKYVQGCLQHLNRRKEQLKVIAGQQYYRLCSWQEADLQINYRRFFTVNSLICLNVQHEEVFEHVHRLIGALLKENIIHGLRIDHIDGLYDPEGYLQRLRALAGDDTYIVVEKILEQGEELPHHWPIQGSTGYDYLAQVNNLFTNQKSEKAFSSFYQQLTADDRPVKKQIRDKKNLILTQHMNGELESLTRLFIEAGLTNGKLTGEKKRAELKQAIGLLLVHFPVYRFYGNHLPLSKDESRRLKALFEEIKEKHPTLSAGIKLLRKALITNPLADGGPHSEEALNFYQRCMQFTGPLMAKGVEDTLMYTYNRFVDHNEVGDSPEAFGLAINEFHRLMQKRQEQWPLAINATSTHDTKRGEGVRARLNVLTNIPEEWISTVNDWRVSNARFKTNGAPDENDEYFIYQTILGSYPMPGEEEETFAQRLDEYLEKMLREAKRRSNWAEPNEDYENAAKKFVAGLLDKTSHFWKTFTKLHKKVSELGIVNSLAQLALKTMCPGVPDIYQGCEHWDLSLVDPDNRRPVDYSLREELLNTAKTAVPVSKMWKERFNGQIKVWLTGKLLQLRAAHPDLFSKGDYIPLKVTGKYKHELIAFARAYRDTWIALIVPVDIAAICGDDLAAPIDWADTQVTFPKDVPVICIDQLLNKSIEFNGTVNLREIISDIPVAILRLNNPYKGRNAGVLLHITSLPGAFGIGDFGPQAFKFARLLHDSKQQYWQILPLNATSAADGHSPYSSCSSQAGNVLLISSEQLANDRLLSPEDLRNARLPKSNIVDFENVEVIKLKLLNKAWKNFQADSRHPLHYSFAVFCETEAVWLNNYALYLVLKQQHSNKPWHKWPAAFKFRGTEALQKFSAENEDALNKEKWLQFIFLRQWYSLKNYCNQIGIKIFGDLPFYISYDSADVWANREIFDLNEELEMNSVSGVPPDYFNEDGQRWGMPTFNWAKLKKSNYDWWVKRIAKNLRWYDLLRLDHFRAFAAYWSIPVDDKTAVGGKWISGPGSDFFHVLKPKFNELPFIAEDLGDIDETVCQLASEFDLPGMKVLQFAFGDDIQQSAYIPHHHSENYFVYTGTHDNNTTLGWYKNDADAAVHQNLKRYTGINVTSKNVNEALIKIAFASVCKTAIIPIQDWLKLDENSRMNIPAIEGGNWTWRLTNKQFAKYPVEKIKTWTEFYNR
jgi:malto-oligosyltrehalose synthase/4-alpha-glucanotransferase